MKRQGQGVNKKREGLASMSCGTPLPLFLGLRNEAWFCLRAEYMGRKCFIEKLKKRRRLVL
jgi:hypothetical protein